MQAKDINGVQNCYKLETTADAVIILLSVLEQ